MKERITAKMIMFGKIFVVGIVFCVISLRTLPVDLVWFSHYPTYSAPGKLGGACFMKLMG